VATAFRCCHTLAEKVSPSSSSPALWHFRIKPHSQGPRNRLRILAASMAKAKQNVRQNESPSVLATPAAFRIQISFSASDLCPSSGTKTTYTHHIYPWIRFPFPCFFSSMPNKNTLILNTIDQNSDTYAWGSIPGFVHMLGD